MDLDWEKLVKRYVWNDERTPYFTRVGSLTRRQAHYELFGYAFLVGVLCAVLAVAALASGLPHAEGVSLYAFTVCCAAVFLGATRHPWAALWCAGAPLAGLAYFAVWGFPGALDLADKALIVAVMAAWLVYSRRLVAVARAWQGLAGRD
ncbi:MAG: hypothetical protein ACT4P4_11815 [Betaproteobacteria bacterium]